MAKYKVGDTVRNVSEDDQNIRIGGEYKITEIDEGINEFTFVDEIGTDRARDIDDCDFELVTKKRTPKIKKYVVSSTGFSTKKAALEQLEKWREDGTLKMDNTFIFEVKKAWKPVSPLKLKEVK